MKPFARCNAVRLTHERFRADTQGLIKALEQVLTEADAAREEEEASRLKAKADEKAATEKDALEERRKQKQRDEVARQRAAKQKMEAVPGSAAKPHGAIGWIAGLPSEISWHVSIGVVAVALLGWFLPGQFFLPQSGLGWGAWSLLYGLAGLIAVGVVFYVRRGVLGGAELALYWYASISFFALMAPSAVTAWGLAGTINADLPIAGLALLTAVSLIAVRRTEIGGLEFAVYWFALALILFWGTIPLIAEPAAASALGTYFTDNAGYRAAGIVLAGIAVISALAILLWRRSRLSGPETAVYLLGAAYMVSVGLRLA